MKKFLRSIDPTSLTFQAVSYEENLVSPEEIPPGVKLEINAYQKDPTLSLLEMAADSVGENGGPSVSFENTKVGGYEGLLYEKTEGGKKSRGIYFPKPFKFLWRNNMFRLFFRWRVAINLLFVFSFGLGAGYLLSSPQTPLYRGTSSPSENPQDIYADFLTEIYMTISENHWKVISDEQLGELFRLGAEKITGKPQKLNSANKEGVRQLFFRAVASASEEEKKKFVTQLADLVLANLEPFARSRLYSLREEKDLANQVQNIDPSTDQYAVLGVEKTAASEEIEKAYQEISKKLSLKKDSSPEAKQKFEEAQRAYETLKDQESRRAYDQLGVEPSLNYLLLRPEVFYLHLKKFSPQTLGELERVTAKIDKESNPDSLILDLRDNIGGSIDSLPYLLGPFIGQDQYAYQFFKRQEKIDFKTTTGWLPSLVRYKKVIVLINGGTQSSAELFAATLKKYNVGIFVGEKTKGWGTVEKVFPLKAQIDPAEKYSIFLTHSLTLREDGQPIEGRGVEPLIYLNDPNWLKQVENYFPYPPLLEALKENIFNR